MGPRDTHVAQIWSSYQVKYDKQRIKSKYTLTLKKESKMGRKRGIENFLASIFDFIVYISHLGQNMSIGRKLALKFNSTHFYSILKLANSAYFSFNFSEQILRRQQLRTLIWKPNHT